MNVGSILKERDYICEFIYQDAFIFDTKSSNRGRQVFSVIEQNVPYCSAGEHDS